MADTISASLLQQISALVERAVGLHFPEQRWHDLERGIRSAARELGFSDPESCVQQLISEPLTRAKIGTLATYLTIGETYFLREKDGFDFLEREVLPQLVRSRSGGNQTIRIWCAGCCTGEEPYSVAMLIDRVVPHAAGWRVTILGTDVNPHFLDKASTGIYREWSFRGTPSWIKGKYFRSLGDGVYEILPRIKKMVRFSYLNLAEDGYPSLLSDTNAVDVVLCRNVLMYFADRQARRVVSRLYAALLEGGWLITGANDGPRLLDSLFATVALPGAAVYRKERTGAPRPLPAALADLHVGFRPTVPWVPYADVPEAPRSRPSLEAGGEQPIAESPRTPYDDASVLYQHGQYAEACAILARLLSGCSAEPGASPGDAKAIALLAEAYANQGQLDEALQWCERGIAAHRLNPSFHYLRAAILQEQGLLEEAAASLKRALYLDQDFVPAHITLGSLRRQQGRLDESKKHFENALSALSGSREEETVPGSDGITAGRLMDIIRSMSWGDATHERRETGNG